MKTAATQVTVSAASMAKSIGGTSGDTDGLVTAVNESAATMEELALDSRSVEE